MAKAIASGDCTGELAAVGISIPAVAPDAPNMTAIAGNGEVTLSWSVPFNGGANLAGYRLSMDNGMTWISGITAQTYTFSGLNNDKEYTFKLVAINSAGESEAAVTMATPKAPPSGGSDGTASTTTVTIPVIGNATTVNIKVAISGITATVVAPTTGELNAVLELAKATNEPVKLNLSTLSAPLTTVKLPAAMVSEIAKAGTGLEISLPDGSGFTMTGPALTGAAENGGELSISISPVTIASLPANEQTALEGQTVLYTFDVIVKNGGTEMHQLGGFAEITFALGPQYAGRLVDVLHIEDGTAVSAVVATGLRADSNGRVTIQVSSCSTFAVVSSSQLPFTDVATGEYYYDAVAWAIEKAVTQGTSATTFTPDAACTRAQTVTFLWRAMGSPEPTATINPFTDVSPDAYYYKAVLWAAENGITSGTSATTFSPDATVTRAQIVTFLWRSAGQPAADRPYGDFDDVEQGAYYEAAVSWAAENDITSGTGEGIFSPSVSCTRGQIVTFLYRYLGK